MSQSPEINEIAAALARAALEFGAVRKSRTYDNGPLKGKRHATIDDVLEATRAPLAKHGLVLLQGGSQDRPDVLVTRLIHSSGQWFETFTPIFEGQQKGAQGFGSGMTYARRYAAYGILNIAPEDDDDGAQATRRVDQRALTASLRQAEEARAQEASRRARAKADQIIAELGDVDRDDAAKIYDENRQAIEWITSHFPSIGGEISAALADAAERGDVLAETGAGMAPQPPRHVNGNGAHGA
ncbi:MAG: ERF family protein [Pseudomonadota bacterium]